MNNFTLINCNGKLLDLSSPKVMGILNITPDSFYDGGQYTKEKESLEQVEKMLNEGASIIDIGGMSSRPGAELIDENEEKKRVIPIIKKIIKEFPNTIISIDTIRSEIVRAAVGEGALIVNDISAGKIDEKMYSTVAKLNVPYILMHMQGQPQTMQTAPQYHDVVEDVLSFFINEIQELEALGVKDILLDVGFGFGKTIAHNYQLLKRMNDFKILNKIILTGISRKSMIYKLLEIKPQEALNATSALHILALQNGTKILRVHDVKEANECIKLHNYIKEI